MAFWPKDAIKELGRPLQRWDVCPVCGRAANTHRYEPVSRELACNPLTTEMPMYLSPEAFILEAQRAEDRANEIARRKQILAREEQEMALAIVRAEAQRAAGETPRERNAALKPCTPVNGPRKYFDDEE